MQIITGFNFPLKRNAKETAGFDRYATYCSARIHLLRFEKSLTETFHDSFLPDRILHLKSGFLAQRMETTVSITV